MRKLWSELSEDYLATRDAACNDEDDKEHDYIFFAAILMAITTTMMTLNVKTTIVQPMEWKSWVALGGGHTKDHSLDIVIQRWTDIRIPPIFERYNVFQEPPILHHMNMCCSYVLADWLHQSDSGLHVTKLSEQKFLHWRWEQVRMWQLLACQ